jgi:hypothetical protein
MGCVWLQYKPTAPFRAIYKPTPLAAGKFLAITVEFQADQVGDHVSEITVCHCVLQLSVSAATSADDANWCLLHEYPERSSFSTKQQLGTEVWLH